MFNTSMGMKKISIIRYICYFALFKMFRHIFLKGELSKLLITFITVMVLISNNTDKS